VTLLVTEWPDTVQTTNYETGEPEFWPPKNGEAQGNPKMAVVITGTVDGTEKALWVRRYPPLLWEAVVGAQKTAGALIEPGGKLTVTFTGNLANPDKPRLNPSRQFSATYTPKDAFAEPAPAVAAPVPAPAPPVSVDRAADVKAQQALISQFTTAGWTVAQLAAIPAGQIPGLPILGSDGNPLAVAALQAIASLPV
jgi:hypothetical protein